MAKTQIPGSQVRDETITTGNILNETILSEDIQDGTITGADIASETIVSANILDGTVTGDDIASETVTTNNILNGTITKPDINIVDTGLALVTSVFPSPSINGGLIASQTGVDAGTGDVQMRVNPRLNYQCFRASAPQTTGLSWFFQGAAVPHNLAGFEVIVNNSLGGYIRSLAVVLDRNLQNPWTLQLYRIPESPSRTLVDQWTLPAGTRRHVFAGLSTLISSAVYGFCFLGAGNTPIFTVATINCVIEVGPYT